MCENDAESRHKEYKPDVSRATGRDICPADGLTLNDVPAIKASGNYRERIDAYLGTPSGLQTRHTETYHIESLPEADELVRACEMCLKNENPVGSTRKGIKRVKTEASEIARALRAAVDELETTENHPNSRRRKRRLRADGGERRQTPGPVKGRRDMRLDSFTADGHACDNPKCSALADVVTPEGYLCQSCADALRTGELR